MLSDTSPHGAAGGLGAALAALGAELVSGASYVLDAVGFDASTFDLVVTGEVARRDNPAWKGPWRVVRRSAGRVASSSAASSNRTCRGAETVALSGDRGG